MPRHSAFPLPVSLHGTFQIIQMETVNVVWVSQDSLTRVPVASMYGHVIVGHPTTGGVASGDVPTAHCSHSRATWHDLNTQDQRS